MHGYGGGHQPSRDEDYGQHSPALPVSDSKTDLLFACCTCHFTQDNDLTLVVDAWPALPTAIRAGIVAMVRAAKP